MLKRSDRLAIYMQGHVGSPNGKMGYGILRYSPNQVVCVVDSQKAGRDMTGEVGIPGGCPIVASIDDAKAKGADALVLGIANTGGFIPQDWYADLDRAVDLGMSLVNGLHDLLGPRYPNVRAPQWIWDIRIEPKGLGVATGAARKLHNTRLLCVGTDMAIGKMTAALEMNRGARARGRTSEFIATGQTGITIAGSGVPLDAIRVDYACGAIEREVLRCKDAELVFVEGQGALGHPGSTSTLPLMRGSCPTHLVLCHRAGQTALRTLPDVPIPPLREYMRLYQDVASVLGIFPRPHFAGIALNTAHLSEAEAARAIAAIADEVGVPVTDPVRNGPDVLLDAIVA